MEKKIFLDSAATTYLNAEVLQEMLPTFDTVYGNPSSLHNFGRQASNLVDNARDQIAKAINAFSSELYFTSSGTEANNWAIKGLANANKDKGNHIITSQIEHSSVMESCRYLEGQGFKVTYLPVDKYGVVSLAKLMHHLNKDTILVSIMTANNEVGTIQHINAIAKTAKRHGALFHTDAVQAAGSIKLNVHELDVDALTLSAHKIYGPKGVGALYLKKGVAIENMFHGGYQESAKRAGTTNVPGIVGFGRAMQIALRDMKANNEKIKAVKDYFIKKVKSNIDGVHFNGHPMQKVPHIVSVSFDYIEAEAIMMMLDLEGIAVSLGSACTAGSIKQSYVLKAMGVDKDHLNSTLRFSFLKSTTKHQIDYVIEKLTQTVEKLRDLSPLTKKTKRSK